MSYKPEHFTVWAEIPTTDMPRAMAYYSAVTGAEFSIDESGPQPISFFPTAGDGIAGHLYEGKPAPAGTGPTIHLASNGRLEDTLARVANAGGQVVSEPIQIPPGRFAYTLDLDGNSISFFEPN